MGLFKKIFAGLKKTKDAIAHGIASIFGKGELNDEFFENLEEILIMADVGFEASQKIIEELRKTAKKQKLKTADDVKSALKDIIAGMLDGERFDDRKPLVITVVGVNGVGKTTTIGKLASYYKAQKNDVVLAAADTFRAAASEQLSQWAERAKCRIVKHSEGADPGAVVFDAIASVKAKKSDVLIIDTAGRLHNNVNLMAELKKIGKVASVNFEGANFKNFIVIDATTGQNALSQVQLFNESIKLDGVILTKLDGTAKGGVVLQIKEKLGLDVVFVGVGEGVDDLIPFDSKEFAEGLF